MQSDQAAAILNHYFAQLAERSGASWSERNAADIERAVELMGGASPPPDEIPPYEAPIRSERVTQVIDRGDFGDVRFERWRQQRRAEAENDTILRRMLEREER